MEREVLKLLAQIRSSFRLGSLLTSLRYVLRFVKHKTKRKGPLPVQPHLAQQGKGHKARSRLVTPTNLPVERFYHFSNFLSKVIHNLNCSLFCLENTNLITPVLLPAFHHLYFRCLCVNDFLAQINYFLMFCLFLSQLCHLHSSLMM